MCKNLTLTNREKESRASQNEECFCTPFNSAIAATAGRAGGAEQKQNTRWSVRASVAKTKKQENTKHVSIFSFRADARRFYPSIPCFYRAGIRMSCPLVTVLYATTQNPVSWRQTATYLFVRCQTRKRSLYYVFHKR